jgi:hypothetical protein
MAMGPQLKFNRKLGGFGNFEAELTKLEVLNFVDTPPLGGVVTDLQAEATFKLTLLGIKVTNAKMVFTLNGVEVDLSRTPAGMPKGVVLRVTPALSVNITFSNAGVIARAILNGIVGPLVSFGIFVAFRIIREVEVPVWNLVDIFGALGLRFTPNSPLLTAQNAVPPSSLLLASDFNLTSPAKGNGQNLAHFLPTSTDLGAVVHEKVISAAVEIALSKGWVPTQFTVDKWKIYLNSIKVEFELDEIIASGSLKAKRGKCWCRVKARITFRASVKPKVTGAPNSPKVEFTYNADLNAHISTSGMLVVLGVIMFAPVFMALTVGMSFLINILLNQFLPFKTSFSRSGLQLTVKANSVHFSGFVPLSMNFSLQLSGSGSYDLSNFKTFNLPNNGPAMNVVYSNESISLQKDELRLAIGLS